MTRTAIVVFSHLRWDFVFQRPQHLLSRLAATHPIVFFEEPVFDETAATPRLESRPAPAGVEVLRPHTALPSVGFADDQLEAMVPLVAGALAARGIERCVVWFYTPLALPLLDGIAADAVVFDCMDELSAFLHAPEALLPRETALLERADVVLTGGPSLYEAKRGRNPNVLCLPSSVDAAHFAPRPHDAADGHAASARALHAAIATPRLGYFGVIDERMDLALVAQLADARPDWQIVMVGPIVKIDESAVPKRPNLHWLGQQPYARLPWLAAEWQVCLMPFALNASTRFISPTKTLEYLAAGKPVVSTAVRDVSVLYAEAVQIAADADAFVAACERALAESDDEKRDRLRAGAAVVARDSWDRTVARIESALDACLDRRDVDESDVEPRSTFRPDAERTLAAAS